MRWPEDLAGWPMAEHSRLVSCRPHRWHVQEAGQGPTILLIHGAGGAAQSWRGVFPHLAERHHVVAFDLPGQGFTRCGARRRLGLDAMAEDIAALVADQGWSADAIVGHSAGGALALRLASMPAHAGASVVTLNAALASFTGVAGWAFPLTARTLSLTPFAAAAISAMASSPGRVRSLLEGTGSRLDAEGIALYGRLVRDRAHIEGTLGMMAQWSVEGLRGALGRVAARTLLMVGSLDRAVPPETSRWAAERMPDARLTTVEGLGHLMHEEDPLAVARAIEAFLAPA